MIKTNIKFIIIISVFFFCFKSYSLSENVDRIEIIGNERIPKETILMFADIKENEIINTQKINEILKNLYDSNFFENVTINFVENNLRISVTELPIIDKIVYNGIKAEKIKEAITKNLKLKPRSSYNTLILAEDNKVILNTLRDLGYYFSKIETFAEEKKDNKIDIRYEISLGEKAKIKKISFVGNKIFKDRKLINIIISEEYKFWKIISGKNF